MTPNAGFSGDDSFSYRANDATQSSGVTLVSLSVLPKIQSVEINGDVKQEQRSMVGSIKIFFNTEVAFTGAPSDAFDLRRTGGTMVNGMYVPGTLGSIPLATRDVSLVGGKTQVILHFAGANARSLEDGKYTLTILSTKVHGSSSGAELDGDGNGTAGGNRVDQFFRLLGDQDGDGDVDATDYKAFSDALNGGLASYQSYFDFDGNGVIDRADLNQISLRRNRIKII